MTDEQLQKYINNPRINVFDIYEDKKSSFKFGVYTYPKPGESEDEFIDRDCRNFQTALELKQK
jgi:hypothetical protein